ncbi:MAG: peptidase [SAR86 cluster bacterium]|uniref:Peptidase n=1 Tax=SAR86 cluster bacterium TaxID=2030880 RepID=A0A2A5AEK8_9GAMM|nr:MAG: peptidase [SAR86 cluster bacterium]
MKLTSTILTTLLVTLLGLSYIGNAGAAEEIQSIEEATDGAQFFDGYFNFYYQPANGSILVEINEFDTEFLYANSLATGIGSNDIGLDRGQINAGRIVKFERHGNKVFLKQLNLQYRAQSDNELERLAVEEAFAESILWGFTVAAESDDRVLIDVTEFFLSDVHGIVNTLSARDQGNYSLDQSRSAIYLPRTKNFPLNSEFEAQLTFTSARGGSLVRTVTPSADAITVRLHHSFVQLPDDNYTPRIFHPQSGYWARSFEDYAAPIDEDITQRYISRHRLQKQNPNAASSAAIEPIIYYLDPGVPEPIRSALLDGARWWNGAFEAIGFENGFQVELLPADADPMDIRYNVIQWVHRSTRGWSYGASLTDPRTGEIIKGKVTLGSLRVRQDYRIAQSLIGLAMEGANESIQQLALSRIRQLAAHEVGHTLGIAHNFAASINQRASVMDYPHPLIDINDNGVLNAINAYDIGLGQWDYQVIKYGYSTYGNSNEESAGLANTLEENQDAGLLYISDADSRAPGSAHPLSHMWDNGASPTDELAHLLDVRQNAMNRFGAANLNPGQPYAELEEVLVPLYLLHRYQIEAVHKIIGGTYYDYSVYDGNPDNQSPKVVAVPAEDQWQALDALLATLEPDVLVIPQSILQMIPPKPIGYSRNRESFPLRTSLGIDYAAIAETAADHTLKGILQHERLTRISNLNGTDPSLPAIHEILDRLLERVYYTPHSRDPQSASIQRVVNHVLLYRMMSLVRNDKIDNRVKSQINYALHNLQDWLTQILLQERDSLWNANYQLALDEINNWFNRGAQASLLTAPLPMPPGAPI